MLLFFDEETGASAAGIVVFAMTPILCQGLGAAGRDPITCAAACR